MVYIHNYEKISLCMQMVPSQHLHVLYIHVYTALSVSIVSVCAWISCALCGPIYDVKTEKWKHLSKYTIGIRVLFCISCIQDRYCSPSQKLHAVECLTSTQVACSTVVASTRHPALLSSALKMFSLF